MTKNIKEALEKENYFGKIIETDDENLVISLTLDEKKYLVDASGIKNIIAPTLKDKIAESLAKMNTMKRIAARGVTDMVLEVMDVPRTADERREDPILFFMDLCAKTLIIEMSKNPITIPKEFLKE